MRRLLAAIVATGAALLAEGEARAQDLFELEVFPYETTAPGRYEVALHANGLPGGAVPSVAPAERHRPVHMSVELTRGWTSRLETAVFVQAAPFGPDGSARFAGGHLRTKLRIGTLPGVPVRLALGGEYAFNRDAFSDERQTAEIKPIIDFEQGRLTLIANPSVEVVTRGPDGLGPAVNLAARAAWQLVPSLRVTADYFSRASHTRHLRPEPEAHRFVFSGVEIELPSGWEWSLSAGHCVTRNEPWLVSSVLAHRF